jgi:hypothetical protein
VSQFGDDADIRFAPPFAIGDYVQASVLLHGYGVADGGLHLPLECLGRNRAAVVD